MQANVLETHWWVIPTAAIVWTIVRLLKDDVAVKWFPASIDPKYRVWLALLLGLIGGVLDEAIAKGGWDNALGGGLAAALFAISTQAGILSITGGREVGQSKSEFLSDASNKMFPPTLILLCALGLGFANQSG